MSEEHQKPKPLFKNLNADDPEPETTEIESLCLNCGENVSFYLLYYVSYNIMTVSNL